MAIWYWWLSSLGVAAPFCEVHHYACELWSCPLIASWLAILLARVSCALGYTEMLFGQARYKTDTISTLLEHKPKRKSPPSRSQRKAAPSSILEKQSHLWEAQTSGETEEFSLYWRLAARATSSLKAVFSIFKVNYLSLQIPYSLLSRGLYYLNFYIRLQHNPRHQVSNHNKIKSSFLNLLHLGKISLYNIHNLPTPLQQLITKSHHTLLLW